MLPDLAKIIVADHDAQATLAQARQAGAGGLAQAGAISQNPEVVKWAFMSTAIAAGLGVLGGAIAVAVVGAAAMGAISEKPELFARALI